MQVRIASRQRVSPKASCSTMQVALIGGAVLFPAASLAPLMPAQHSVHPTGGSRRVFRQFAWLEVGSGKMALSRPAHPRVTQTVEVTSG